MRTSLIAVSSFLLVCSLSSGCSKKSQSPEELFAAAEKTNTVAAYQTFSEKFPEHPKAATARERIRELNKTSAKKKLVAAFFAAQPEAGESIKQFHEAERLAVEGISLMNDAPVGRPSSPDVVDKMTTLTAAAQAASARAGDLQARAMTKFHDKLAADPLTDGESDVVVANGKEVVEEKRKGHLFHVDDVSSVLHRSLILFGTIEKLAGKPLDQLELVP